MVSGQPGPGSKDRIYRCRLVVLVVLALPLSACGYFPSPSQAEAKRVAVDKLRSTSESLPKPGDFTVAKFPGMDSDDVIYRGNYRARDASLHARYLTSLLPEQTCQSYLRFVETRPRWTHVRPPCGAITGTARVIDVMERFPGGSEIQFRMTIVVGTPQRQPSERDTSGSEIRVEMRYAVDERAEMMCMPAALTGKPPPCAEADWNGLE